MQRRIAVLIGCAVVAVFAASGVEAKRYHRHQRAHAADTTKVKNLADPAPDAADKGQAQGAPDPTAAQQQPAVAAAATQQPQAATLASAQPASGEALAGQPVAAQPDAAAAMPASATQYAPLPANPPLPPLLASLFQPRAPEVQAPPPPEAPAAVGEATDAGGTTVVANTPMRALVAKHAAANGVPFSLAHAVIMIESKYAARIAHAGNYGLMQIRAETARSLGFTGSALGLLDPETNLRFGMKYLAMAYKLARGDTCGTVMRYQSGVMTTRMSAANRAYCARARGFMARM